MEGYTAWLFDCSEFVSPLYEADKCFDHIPIYYQDAVMYIDPKTRQNFIFASPIYCDNNPQIVLSSVFDTDEQFVLTPEPVL